MKIGILTFIQPNNYGTILQVYCMQKNLEKTLGGNYCIEVINIEYLRRYLSYIRHSFRSLHLSSIINNMHRNLLISKFMADNIRLSPERILIQDVKRGAKMINSLGYDLIICGSDEIWSSKIPLPSIYYAPGISAKKVSYAASANRSDFAQISDEKRNALKSILNEFKFITVRDITTQNFLKELGIGDTHIVGDPTMVYDFPKINVVPRLEREGIDMSKPVIGLMLFNQEIAKKILTRYKDYQIVNLYGYLAGFNNVVLTPLEFVNVFRYFSLVVTDSFHGTIFSIKNEANFLSIDSNLYTKAKSKINCLLSEYGLLQHYVQILDQGDFNKIYCSIESLLSNPIRSDASRPIEMAKQSYDDFIVRIKEVAST